VLVLPLGHAMLATATTGLVAETVLLRKPARRALFNAAQSSLAVTAAAWVIGAMAGVPATEFSGELNALPLLMAGAAYFAVNTTAVSLAVALHERVPFTRAWWTNFGGGYELLSNGALFSLGALMATHYVAMGPWGVALATLPLLVAFEGYRRMVRTRREAGRTEPPACVDARIDAIGPPAGSRVAS
jgi:hypothetical protein